MKTHLFALFLVPVLLLSSCSGRKPSEIYAEGVAAEDSNKTVLALERYEEVVRDFPTEALAESSLYRIVMIRSGTATDRQKVIAAQMQFLDLFPKSERVPTMIFMMAFIYNNEIRDIDSARKYYEMFVSSWPDHELAPSARFELETLGKGPEEFLGRAPGEGDDASGGARGEGRR